MIEINKVFGSDFTFVKNNFTFTSENITRILHEIGSVFTIANANI